MKKKYPLFFLLIAVVFFLFIIFYSELKGISSIFISRYGFIGLFVFAVVLDTIIQPVSPDILVFGSTFGGANLFLAALIGGLGSCTAGTIGYFIGRTIGKHGFKKWFGEKHLKRGKELLNKYGVWAVIVGALSPIPYSSVCWTAGIYNMRFSVFLLTSLLTRIPRFLLIGLIGHLL